MSCIHFKDNYQSSDHCVLQKSLIWQRWQNGKNEVKLMKITHTLPSIYMYICENRQPDGAVGGQRQLKWHPQNVLAPLSECRQAAPQKPPTARQPATLVFHEIRFGSH